MPSRAYSVTTPILGPDVSSVYYVDAPTSRKGASKARMKAFHNARDAGFEIHIKDVKVRSLGIRETPREIAQRTCDAFNAQHKPGDLVKCYPVIPPHFADEPLVKVLAIREPGAFVMASGTPVVAVTGDCWAIEAVLPVGVVLLAEAPVDINPVVYDEEGVPF